VWDQGDGDGAVGYVLGTDDTRAFQRWFVEDWWPSLPARERQTEGDGWLLPAAADAERMLIDAVDDYPAHLHIDLLPQAQGKGAGRLLIDAACALLAERGVAGVHLVAGKDNLGAQAFYPRVGFEPIAQDGGSVTFARRLT
jgi:ribosomal protein S18 acetylase RimI-like enzyme